MKVPAYVVVNKMGEYETRPFGPKHGAERQKKRLDADEAALSDRGPFTVIEIMLGDDDE